MRGGWSVRQLLWLLLIGLLGLALFAIVVQVREARSNMADRRALLEANTERLSVRIAELLERDATLVRAAPDPGPELCPRLTPHVRVVRLATLPRTLCESDVSIRVVMSRDVPRGVTISDREDLVLQRVGTAGGDDVVLFYPEASFLSFDYFAGGLPKRDIVLTGNDRSFALSAAPPPLPFSRGFARERAVAGTPFTLTVRAPLFAEGWTEFAARLTPFLLWTMIALIASVVVSRLVLRPIETLADRIDAYRPGEPWRADAPVSRFAELLRLEDRFVDMAGRVAADRGARDEAVEHQQALTREVHHRVKNNLQIMASMIGLHARATTDPSALGAFALIQRRIDALSAVHRNHVAVAEGDAGVLLSRLFTDLQQAFDEAIDARPLELSVETADVMVDQDVALPLALFVTELAEQALRLGGTSLAVTIGARDAADGWITVASPVFAGIDERDPAWRGTDRILRGFSRQLRRPLERSRDGGGFTLGFSLLHPRDDRTP